MADQSVNGVLQFRAPHFQFFDFLVGREIDFFLDATHFVIQPMIFIEELMEVIVGNFETPNRFAMFREFAIDGMMQVHWFISPFQFVVELASDCELTDRHAPRSCPA
jgi:hypothetical protein